MENKIVTENGYLLGHENKRFIKICCANLKIQCYFISLFACALIFTLKYNCKGWN